jgi:hypothetical protein
MTQTIVNLTLPLVVAKINDVLNDAPDWDEWQMLAMPELHQRLVAYVVRRLPVVYVTLESEMLELMHTPSSCYSHEQHLQMEELIQQGLQVLLEHQRQLEHQHQRVTPANLGLVEAGAGPSTWFG